MVRTAWRRWPGGDVAVQRRPNEPSWSGKEKLRKGRGLGARMKKKRGLGWLGPFMYIFIDKF